MLSAPVQLGSLTLPNAVLLGAFAGLAGQISLPAVVSAIRDKFSGKVAEGNIAAATAACQQVKERLRAQASLQPDQNAPRQDVQLQEVR